MKKILSTRIALTGLSLGVSASTLFAASSAIAQFGGKCSTSQCYFYFESGEYIEGECGYYGQAGGYPVGCACWVYVAGEWFFQPQPACVE